MDNTVFVTGGFHGDAASGNNRWVVQHWLAVLRLLDSNRNGILRWIANTHEWEVAAHMVSGRRYHAVSTLTVTEEILEHCSVQQPQ